VVAVANTNTNTNTNLAYRPLQFKTSFFGSWISAKNRCWTIQKGGYGEYILRMAGLALPPEDVGVWPSLSSYAFKQHWWKIAYRQNITEDVGVFNLKPGINRRIIFIADRDTWLLKDTQDMYSRVMYTAYVWEQFIPGLIWDLWVVDLPLIGALHTISYKQFMEVHGGISQLKGAIHSLLRYLEMGGTIPSEPTISLRNL
jgi:hypothetical protein